MIRLIGIVHKVPLLLEHIVDHLIKQGALGGIAHDMIPETSLLFEALLPHLLVPPTFGVNPHAPEKTIKKPIKMCPFILPNKLGIIDNFTRNMFYK